MERRRLIEYLNDPTLLHSISLEELKQWSSEVSYSGLIQKLVVQKLILDQAEAEQIEKATTLSILNNAHPEVALKSIEDFKQWILTEAQDVDDDEINNVSMSSPAHSISDEDRSMAQNNDADLSLTDQQENQQVEDTVPMKISEVNILPEKNTIVAIDNSIRAEADSSELEGFTQWLVTLKPVNTVQKEEEEDKLKLKDSELASAALAELLVEQGHIDRAIAMYELLMLKNPQKSSFFAAQIQKLKAL